MPEASYRPSGYCPHCDYPVDPGVCPECGRRVARPRSQPRRVRRQRLLRWGAAILVLAGLAVVGYFYGAAAIIRVVPSSVLFRLRDEGGRYATLAWAESKRRYESRFSAIRVELAQLGAHPWAGEYGTPDVQDAGCYLALAPKEGYVYRDLGWNGWGPPDYGEVEDLGGQRLRMSSAGGGPEALRGPLVIVPWGSRLYMVPEDTMIDFCNEVNGYGYAALWACRPERSGESAGAAGLPQVPPEYRAYLPAEPIVGEVVQVELVAARYPASLGGSEEPCSRAIVTLNVGSDGGVLPRMKFWLRDSNFDGVGMNISQVSSNTCTGPTDEYLLPGRNLEDECGIRIGARFSTQYPRD